MKNFKLKYVVWLGIAAAIIGGAVVAVRGQTLAVELGTPTNMTVYEYIAEDGKTRLADTYLVDMPVSGTIEPIALKVGDVVKKGAPIAQVESYAIEQRIRELRSMIDQSRARVSGVDILKPKEVEIESASIHIREMEDALDIARRNRAVVDVNLHDAKRNYERAEKLLADGVVSQSFYDEADMRYKGLLEEEQRDALQEESAKKGLQVARLAHKRLVESIDDNEYMRDEFHAQIEGQEAQLAILEHDLKKTQIHAPVSGPVLEKYVADRRVLRAGEQLLLIGDLDSIEIECDVLSEEISRVAEGQRVEISGKALQGTKAEGRVSRIHPSGFMKISALGVEQQRVRVLIGFDNTAIHLRPGTSVDLQIIANEAPDATAIPDRAVFRRDGSWYVFVVDVGHARLRSVEVGLRNDEWAQVTSGLNADDTIVTEPKNELEDGSRISAL